VNADSATSTLYDRLLNESNENVRLLLYLDQLENEPKSSNLTKEEMKNEERQVLKGIRILQKI
jgi:hypothetical protein